MAGDNNVIENRTNKKVIICIVCNKKVFNDVICNKCNCFYHFKCVNLSNKIANVETGYVRSAFVLKTRIRPWMRTTSRECKMTVFN